MSPFYVIYTFEAGAWQKSSSFSVSLSEMIHLRFLRTMAVGDMSHASVPFISVIGRMNPFRIHSVKGNWRIESFSLLPPILSIHWHLQAWFMFPSPCLSLGELILLGFIRTVEAGGLTHVSVPFCVIDTLTDGQFKHVPFSSASNWSMYDNFGQWLLETWLLPPLLSSLSSGEWIPIGLFQPMVVGGLMHVSILFYDIH